MPLDNTFKLSPDQAIKWFENKGFTIGWDWFDVWQQEHAKAFTVAKAMSFDVLMDIRQATDQALKQGLTGRQFRASLTNKLKSKGWWGKKELINPKSGALQQVQLGSPWRLNTIYQTNSQASMMSGRWKQFWQNRNDRPYLQYIAVLDNITRPEHARLNGKIFKIDDPIWQKIWPPNGFNCRCRVRALTEKQAKQRGFKSKDKFKLPDGFPDKGFDHNHGIGQVANDIKTYKSWYRLHEIKNQPFVNLQIKSHVNNLINLDFFSSVFDKMVLRDKPIGEKLVAGYLNKKVFDSFNPRVGHGAIIIPDRLIPKGISELDWRLLPSYLTGNKTTSIEGRKIIITFKQQKGRKIIKLTINTDMTIVKAEYEN